MSKKITMDELIEILDDHNFIYHGSEDSTDLEIESWTDGGVNMFMILHSEDVDLKDPNSVVKGIIEYIDAYDPDEEVDKHRIGDSKYREDFTPSESIEDFKEYGYRLSRLKYDLLTATTNAGAAILINNESGISLKLIDDLSDYKSLADAIRVPGYDRPLIEYMYGYFRDFEERNIAVIVDEEYHYKEHLKDTALVRLMQDDKYMPIYGPILFVGDDPEEGVAVPLDGEQIKYIEKVLEEGSAFIRPDRSDQEFRKIVVLNQN